MWYRASILALLVVSIIVIAPAARAHSTGALGAEAICSLGVSCPDTLAMATELAPSRLAMRTSELAGGALVAQEPVNSGFGLAWVVMGLLGVSLLYALMAAVLVAMGREAPVYRGGSTIPIPVLAILGLGVALYLTYVETQNVAAICGPVGDCNAVQTSPFAKLFGFLPVGLLGALGYVAILVAWALARRSDGTPGRLAALVIFGMALFGVLFSIYLTYLELYIIRAVCMWCLASAVIMSLVLALSVKPALEALQSDQ